MPAKTLGHIFKQAQTKCEIEHDRLNRQWAEYTQHAIVLWVPTVFMSLGINAYTCPLAAIPFGLINAHYHWHDFHNNNKLNYFKIGAKYYEQLAEKHPKCAARVDELVPIVSKYNVEELSKFATKFFAPKHEKWCSADPMTLLMGDVEMPMHNLVSA